MSEPKHEDCRELLRQHAAALGSDVTVSTARPLVAGPYETAAFECPHGTTFYIQPTGEQIAQWVKDGTP